MVPPQRRRLARPGTWLALLVTLAVAACTATAPDSDRAPDPSGTVRVAYDGGTAWLATLDPAEAGQQVQDWARLGLASALRMPADRLAGQLYDGAVLRDPSTARLVSQPVGAGRTLFDGTVLHVLVPESDPHRQRTIGELLDTYRTDRGGDPPQTQVHTVAVDAADRSVTLTGEPARPTAQARAENGWVEGRVDDPASLAGLVGRIDQLARLEDRGGQLWASGWDWPDVSGDVTATDLAVLARGYREPGGSPPAFSLDLGPVRDPADLAAAAGISPALAAAVLSGNYAGSGFASATDLRDVLEDALLRPGPLPPEPAARGLPADRTRLWALLTQLDGGGAYSQARYEGGLAGTEVGMSLFYTDYVAKDWTSGVGSGVPTGVPGFVPDTRTHTPAGLCSTGGTGFSSGRLWFGQNTAAFGYAPDGVDIGRQATRLFFRSDAGGGREIEPDYATGRGLAWFDRNYQAIADHEPQYRRLEQLMRWSGALEWLTVSGRSLPDAAPAPSPTLRFADWYAAHPELRERAPLAFVRPPSAGQESVLTVPSAAFDDCGVTQVVGGVSLADSLTRGGGTLPSREPLPPELSRAAPVDPARTSVDPAGNGTIARTDPSVQFRIRQGPDAAQVTATGPAARGVPFGRSALDSAAGRSQTLTFRGSGPDYAFDQRIGDVSTGETQVSGTTEGARVTVTGMIAARFTAFVDGLRAGGATRAPGYRFGYPDAGGQVFVTDAGYVRTGPPSSSFTEGLVVTLVDEAGRPVRVAHGAPTELAAPDVARRRTQESPAAIVPPGESVLDAFREGQAVYTQQPAQLAGAVPTNTPFEVRSARPADDSGTVPPGDGSGPGGQAGVPGFGRPDVPVPTGANGPGGPGGGGGPNPPGGGGNGSGPSGTRPPFPAPLPLAPTTTSSTPPPAPTAVPYDTPVQPGRWVFVGFGTGRAVRVPAAADAIGLVTVCAPGTAGCTR